MCNKCVNVIVYYLNYSIKIRNVFISEGSSVSINFKFNKLKRHIQRNLRFSMTLMSYLDPGHYVVCHLHSSVLANQLPYLKKKKTFDITICLVFSYSSFSVTGAHVQ